MKPDRTRPYNVTLPPSVAAKLRTLGSGNLSAGIRIALYTAEECERANLCTLDRAWHKYLRGIPRASQFMPQED